MMDKSTAKKIHVELEQAIETLNARFASEYGLSLSVPTFRYTRESGAFTAKIEGCAIANGVVKTKEHEAFTRFAPLYDLDVSLLGANVRLGGKEFKVLGWRPRARTKHILLADTVTGKQYTCHAESLKTAARLTPA